jgi:uncharacterized membrane protein
MGVQRRIMGRLPSSPRCRFCQAPFGGVGRFVGIRPSGKNPNYCESCFDVLPTRRAAHVLRSLVLLLAASLLRGVGVIDGLLSPERPVPELSLFDRAATPIVSRLSGIRPGTDAYQQLDRDGRRFYRKFNQHPLATLIHVLPAALFMLLVPLQFSTAVRRRTITWHRWSGRLIVALTVPIALSGLFFGLFMPFSGMVEASAIVVFSTWILLSLARALVSVRRGQIERHREWMTRMFSVAIGVSVVRIWGLLLAVATRDGPAAWFGASVWLGFTTAVLVAEIWIRSVRRSAPASTLVGHHG